MEEIHSKGEIDTKSYAQRFKQVQNLKSRMAKEEGPVGLNFVTIQQLRDLMAGYVENRKDRDYFDKLGKLSRIVIPLFIRASS